ncbi:MAG: hypothetical protein K8U03_16705 [Planctomycetia bacterium]|nr:hypothetical protein [Planctomycetia bacterium]
MPQLPPRPQEALQSEVAAPPAEAHVGAGKTPEQLAKEKRVEELKNELVVCYSGPDPGTVILQATPFAAIISMVLVYYIFRRRPRRAVPERIFDAELRHENAFKTLD